MGARSSSGGRISQVLYGLECLGDDERTQRVLILVGQDVAHQDIADQLGLGLKTIRKIIENHNIRTAKKGIGMNQPHGQSEMAKLISRSSLGARGARQARSRVPITTAQAVVARSNGLSKSSEKGDIRMGTGHGSCTYTPGVTARQTAGRRSKQGGEHGNQQK